MHKYSKYISSGIVGAMALAMPLMVMAQVGGGRLGDPFARSQRDLTTAGDNAGVSSGTSLPVLIGNIINVILGFSGILLLGYLLFGGFKWMTSGGDTKGVEAGQLIIRNAIIGLVIIVASYAISNFVVTKLSEVAR